MKTPNLVPLALLKILLASRGMRISDLANPCGRSCSHIYNVVSGQKQSPKLIAKIEKVIGLPLWTAPEAKVPVTVGPSGLQMIVSAVEAVLLESRLATLREINPDGNFSISGLQHALAINDSALLDRLASHSNREGVTADEHHAEASATFSGPKIPSDLGAAQKDYLPGEAPLPASSPGQPPPFFP